MLRVLACVSVLCAAACAAAPDPAPTSVNAAEPAPAAPLIIAHRGSSGERPEHTLEAYALAIEQGADAIEPDLVMTSDGVLVARHDLFLSTTTDVADRPEFADRRRVLVSDPDGREDWWVFDFTLEELKTLRARQPFPGRSSAFDDQFTIPTFAEVVALAKAANAERADPIIVYPEAKAPRAHANVWLSMDQALIAELEAAGWTGADAPVFVQSFDPEFLRALNTQIDTPLVQLVYPETPGAGPNVALDALAEFADGVGPNKVLVIDEDGADTGFLADAHALGLVVHPWTFRDDRPSADGVSGAPEITRMLRLGADGVFTDFPATGRAAADDL